MSVYTSRLPLNVSNISLQYKVRIHFKDTLWVMYTIEFCIFAIYCFCFYWNSLCAKGSIHAFRFFNGCRLYLSSSSKQKLSVNGNKDVMYQCHLCIWAIMPSTSKGNRLCCKWTLNVSVQLAKSIAYPSLT